MSTIPTSLIPAIVALGVGLVVTPLCRLLALRLDFVDRPGGHKSHAVATPYLGGVSVVTALLAGALSGGVERGDVPLVDVVCLVVIAALGLIDDARQVPPLARMAVQVGAACAVIATGVRWDVTGVRVLDAGLALVWIVGITNALNFLDNMDGLAAGVATAAGIAVWVCGPPRSGTALIAAALTGACVGFLPFNGYRARIYLGDAGSTTLGFTLAVLTLQMQLRVGEGRLAALIVPLLVLGLPVTDIALVTVERLRRGIPVTQGGRNHLSHRLVALGLSRSMTVLVLVLVGGAVSAAGTAIARHAVPFPVAVAAALATVAALVLVGLRADVFGDRVVPSPVPVAVAARPVAVPDTGADDRRVPTGTVTVAPPRVVTEIDLARLRKMPVIDLRDPAQVRAPTQAGLTRVIRARSRRTRARARS